MDVEAAMARNVQHDLGQNQAIGGHHHHVRSQQAQLLLGRLILQGQGLEYFAAPGQGQLLHRRSLQGHTPARRPVGLGQDQGNVVACLVKGGQGPGGKFGSAGKDDFHGGRTRRKEGRGAELLPRKIRR
jgi:hypothetical protein